jgi:hypothetical protein
VVTLVARTKTCWWEGSALVCVTRTGSCLVGVTAVETEREVAVAVPLAGTLQPARSLYTSFFITLFSFLLTG